jgi:hypothetical protein
MNKKYFWVLLIFLTTTGFGNDAKLIGSKFDLEETANEADFSGIVVFESLGLRDVAESNCFVYIGAKIKTKNYLFSNKISSQTVNFIQQTFPESELQELPELGKEYLVVGFFGGSEFLNIRKISEATPENVKIVRTVASRRGIQPVPASQSGEVDDLNSLVIDPESKQVKVITDVENEEIIGNPSLKNGGVMALIVCGIFILIVFWVVKFRSIRDS